jgi:hypothetical protein
MDLMLESFQDELIKVAAKPVQVSVDLQKAYREAKKSRSDADEAVHKLKKTERRKSSEGYLLSMALGALAAPAALVGGRRVKSLLARKLRLSRKAAPPTTIPEVGGSMAHGALAGAIVKMLRDRYAKQS